MRYPIISRIFLCFGALLFLIGMFVRMIFATWDTSSLFYISVGMACLAAAVIFDLKGFYHLLQPRSIQRGFRAFGLVVVMLASLIAINYFLADHPAKFDFSPGQLHTLTPFSKNVAKSFTDKVEMLYLQIPDSESKYTDSKVLEAIKKYQDENSKINYSKINLMEHPELVEKYRLSDKEQAMFFVYKDRFERFYKTDEESMTKALLRILKGRKTIYFSVGHGESKTDNKNQRGLSSLRSEIERLFYDVTEINLDTEMIPKDAAGLAIIGPDRNLGEKAGNKVLDYLAGGGRVFLAFDPVQNPDNDNFLKNFGLKTAVGIVHQEENALANVGSFVVSGFMPEKVQHKVLENLTNDSPVIFYVTNAILHADNQTDYQISDLMVTIPTALLRSGYSKQDKVLAKGQFPLFVSAKNSKGGEIFVSGDSDIFANQFLYQHSNPTLMFNLFSYLSTDEDMIKVTPTLPSASKDFLVTDVTFKLYLGFFILGLPVLFFSFGGFVWVRRRWM